MAKRVAREGSSFCLSRSSFLTHPAGVGRQPYKPPSVLRLLPTSFQARASLVEALLRSTSTNDRCGLRVERLPSPSPLSLTPTPLLRHGVGPLSLRLRQQTLFKGYSNALSRHRSYVAVSGASLYPLPRNLRLLFRLVRTGIFTPSSGRRTAAVRHHPPAHKRTDERTMFSQWHSHLPPIRAKRIIRSGRIGILSAYATM